ncbi:MAG TPA: PQQ-binding-like beta-propeller repeat protein [Chloroflexota bacterium]|nr:PQQ-binding-like beta-propeller repeat protein [Chloroflexota bacterium]
MRRVHSPLRGPWGRRWIGLAALGAALLVPAVGAPVPATRAATTVSWPTYLYDNTRSGYNGSETVITASSAPSLKLQWSTHANGTISTQPVVVNYLVYWGAWDGYERATHATGASAGQTAWTSPFLSRTVDSGCDPTAAGVASSATVASVAIGGTPRSVLFLGGGGNVDANGNPLSAPQAQFYALDASSGAILWHTPLGVAPDTFIWSSPAYYNGSVYVGVASFGDCPLVQGRVVQLNASTGAVQHTFSVVPNGCTGGGVWGSPSIDQAKGTLYVNTGNPGSCGTGGIAPSAFDGTTLYVGSGQAIIKGVSCQGSLQALNPANGATRWQLCLPGTVLDAVTAVPGLVVIEECCAGGANPVVVVNASSGSILSSSPSQGGAGFYGAASVVNGELYIGDVSGTLYAFSP